MKTKRESMKSTLPDEALNQIFGEARTHSAWLEKPVSDEVLRQLHDLMKWGPTSANGSPARFVFLSTPEDYGRETLVRRVLQSMLEQLSARDKVILIISVAAMYFELRGQTSAQSCE